MGERGITAIRAALRDVLAAETTDEGDLCATIVADRDEDRWVQVLGDSLNVAYPSSDDPARRLVPLLAAKVPVTLETWEAGTYATLRLGSLELEAVAGAVDAVFTELLGRSADYEVTVTLERM